MTDICEVITLHRCLSYSEEDRACSYSELKYISLGRYLSYHIERTLF